MVLSAQAICIFLCRYRWVQPRSRHTSRKKSPLVAGLKARPSQACGQSRERLGAHLGQRPALTPRSGIPGSSPASPGRDSSWPPMALRERPAGAGKRTALRLGGSDDPALDLLVRAMGDAIAVVPGPRGSVNGIVQLARGAADAVALHLLDAASGRWNDPIARGALGGEPVELVHLWRREQGLVVAPGNPHGIEGSGRP